MYFNNSHRPDPTAFEALKPVIAEENELDHEVIELVKVLKFVINKSGFEMTNRITLKHKKTGRTYK